jgi:hypothetical protein
MGYSAKYDGKNLDSATSKLAGLFLFDTGEIEGQLKPADMRRAILDNSRALEMRGRIDGPAVMSALTFYGILRDGFHSDAAQIVGDVIKRLTIGYKGLGREEAAEILRGNLPKEIEIRSGRA